LPALGRIVTNYLYPAEVFSTHGEDTDEQYLLSSPSLFSELKVIYDRLRLQISKKDEMGVMVRMPYSLNSALRNNWHETVVRRMDVQPLLLGFNKLVGYFQKEAVLATETWMRNFGSKPGDEILITPGIPDVSVLL
jgi:hypothetical protein